MNKSRIVKDRVVKDILSRIWLSRLWLSKILIVVGSVVYCLLEATSALHVVILTTEFFKTMD